MKEHKRIITLSVLFLILLAAVVYQHFSPPSRPPSLLETLVSSVNDSENLTQNERTLIRTMLDSTTYVGFKDNASQIFNNENGTMKLYLSSRLLEKYLQDLDLENGWYIEMIDQIRKEGLSEALEVTLLHESIHWRDITAVEPFVSSTTSVARNQLKTLALTDPVFINAQADIVESEFNAYFEEYTILSRLSSQNKLDLISCSLWRQASPNEIWSDYSVITQYEYALGMALIQYHNDVLPRNHLGNDVRNDDKVKLIKSLRAEIDRRLIARDFPVIDWDFPYQNMAKCKTLFQ